MQDAKQGRLQPVTTSLSLPDAVSWEQWLKIDAHEIKKGRALSKIREKVPTVAEMLTIARSA